MLNAAMALDSISPFRSVKLHRLRGSYSVFWAINVGSFFDLRAAMHMMYR